MNALARLYETNPEFVSYCLDALFVLAVGYMVSCHLHPDVDCRKCKGTGKHRSFIYKRARRPCHNCGGTGRTRRFFAWATDIGQPRLHGPRWFKSKRHV
ncbi:hypothetical protein SAMN05421678_106155 [Actinopolymorpha cephalotaxi]|uniref:Uncharacterized protein n=1 Tax=Actinopolymorpha cephalotaxi TaxID=504797 RepID=A0A1I2SHZ6_9ACTN|nr:hypothetical protein SAMN05421678_106155 [Actinopolymorpha cephalotaxi]